MSRPLINFTTAWIISLLTLALAVAIVFAPNASAALPPSSGGPNISPPLALPEIEDSNEKTLPVDTEEPNVPCAEIVNRLESYNSMARQHDGSVNTFLGEVSGKLETWHALLTPLEGTTDAVPIGVFAPLQDGASKISMVTNLAYENSALLSLEMDRLIVSLKECTLTAKPLKP